MDTEQYFQSLCQALHPALCEFSAELELLDRRFNKFFTTLFLKLDSRVIALLSRFL